jgi:hypothetical protein
MSRRSRVKRACPEPSSFPPEHLSGRFNAAARHYRPDEAPAYDPGLWENCWANCYTYALNIPDHGWGRPGQLMLRNLDRVSVRIDPDIKSCVAYFNAFLGKDGLVPIDHLDSGRYKHVLFLCLDIDPDAGFGDFHFYRRDSNGLWSHKGGLRPVSDTDEGGGLIVSPQTCDRGTYTTDVGYYAVPPEGIRYVVP